MYQFNGSSKYLWALVPGHGGIYNGKYDTAPNKMYQFLDGTTFFEGVYNRERKNILATLLLANNISFVDLVPEEIDIPLKERVRRAKFLWKKHKNLIWVEIHANAGRGYGFEVFTSPGTTRSDAIAEHFIEKYEDLKISRGRYDTRDGDKDKEAKFYNLINTPCPAILIEDGFMDNKRDAKSLLNIPGKSLRSLANLRAIKMVEKYL